MARRIQIGDAYKRDRSTLLTIEDGGTSRTNINDVKSVLTIVDKDTIGFPGGPVPLDENGKIIVSYIDADMYLNYPTVSVLDGLNDDGDVIVDTEVTIEITNYSTNIDYEITRTSMCTVSREDNIITFTPHAKKAYFYLNGRKIQLNIVTSEITVPRIISPAKNGVVDHTNLTVTASNFEWKVTQDTFQASWFKITRDDTGIDIVAESGEISPGSKTWSVTLTNPLPEGQYLYYWVKYEGANLGETIWSDPVRAKVATVDRPSVLTPGENETITKRTFSALCSSFHTDGAARLVGSDWELNSSSEFGSETVVQTQHTDSTSASVCNKFTITGPLLVNTNYFLRCRHYSNDGRVTDWSDTRTFHVTAEVTQPVMTYPSKTYDANIGYNKYTNANLILKANVFKSTNNYFEPDKINWQISDNPTFRNPLLDVTENCPNASSTAPTYNCGVNFTPVNKVLYARVKYIPKEFEGTVYPSIWSEVAPFMIEVSIKTPTISTPAANATVAKKDDGAIVIKTSKLAHTVSSATYAHTSSTWEISDREDFDVEQGANIITLVTGVNGGAGLTTLNAYNLEDNKNYWVRVKYQDEAGVISAFSTPRKFKTSAVVDSNGVTFARHESNMGTIMKYKKKDGTDKWLVVADAIYRDNLPITTDLTDYTPSLTAFTNNPYYLSSGTATDNTTKSNVLINAESMEDLKSGSILLTNTIINGYANFFEDNQGTSLTNTDALLTAFGSSSTVAAGKAASVMYNSTHFSLPTIDELVMIYACMFELDAWDATANNYHSYMFTCFHREGAGNWYFGNESSYAWSSTEAGDSRTWVISQSGYVHTASKTDIHTVIPVLNVVPV